LDILVVEDEHDARVVLREILEGAGWRVTTAANGRDALTHLRSGRVRPAIVLVDLGMPMMDGWQLIDELRADPQLASLPVAVQTAHDERSVPPGVVFTLVKPIDAARLIEALAPYLVPRAPR
jgi:CheY-like chemotaxis protein